MFDAVILAGLTATVLLKIVCIGDGHNVGVTWYQHIRPIVHLGSAVIFCIILLHFKPLCLNGIYMFIYSSPPSNYLESSQDAVYLV